MSDKSNIAALNLSARTGTATNQPGCNGRKWMPCAVMIATGSSIKQTAEALGMSYQQVARWRRHPKFKAYVNELHDSAIESAVGILADTMTAAAQALKELLTHEKADIRLEAIDRIEKWVKTFMLERRALGELDALKAYVMAQNTVAAEA